MMPRLCWWWETHGFGLHALATSVAHVHKMNCTVTIFEYDWGTFMQTDCPYGIDEKIATYNRRQVETLCETEWGLNETYQ